MKNKTKNVIRLVIISALIFIFDNAHAVQVQVIANGFITEFINVNNAETFTVTVIYDTDTMQRSNFIVEDINDVFYEFTNPPYGITNLQIGTLNYSIANFPIVGVGIADNTIVATDDFANVPAGTYDAFGFEAFSPGTIFDTNGDPITGLTTAFGWFANTNYYDSINPGGLSTANPDLNTIPGLTEVLSLSSAPYTTFQFAELLDNGNNLLDEEDIVRLAFGVVNEYEVSVIPIPAAAWLLFSGIIGLLGIGYKKSI